MYENILTEARRSIWAIDRNKHREIMHVLENRAMGIRADADSLEAFAADNRRRTSGRTSGAVAILPVFGTILQRGNMFTEASGAVSTEMLGRQLDDMLARKDVGSIILEIDSPGGTVYGVPELGEKIYKARDRKPIVAYVNPYAASAGLWLAVAAGEVVVTPSGKLGAIGVFARHVDYSEQNKMLGMEPTYIQYGDNKTLGNPDEPLSDAAAEELQKHVDEYGRQFDGAVAKYRGVSVAKVRSDFGQGLLFSAKEAVSIGLADRVASLDDTIARLAKGSGKASGRPRAERARRYFQIGY